VSNPAVTPVPHAAESKHGKQYQDSASAATRHLCAGVYVDRSFRDLVIRTVHHNSQRRAVPSYGFDLMPVVRHAWGSGFLDTGLQLAIVGCLVSGLVLGDRLAAALVVYVIFVCLMFRVAAWIVAETFRAQVAAVAEDWFERRKFRIRPETPGSPFLTTQARGILASTSNSRLRNFLGSDQRGNLMSEVWLSRRLKEAILYIHGWLAQLVRRWDDRIFVAEDAAARARGWQISRPSSGFGRVYRDPRWGLISACEVCDGDGGTAAEPCLPCGGLGTIRRNRVTSSLGSAS
jgi:hypothetical protein